MLIYASSSGFPSKRVSNRSSQLLRLARKLKFHLKLTYDTFKKANNKGADQAARIRRLVCACVIRNTPKTGFLASRPIYGILFTQAKASDVAKLCSQMLVSIM